ncbi:hypothetical protein Taro_045564, partial [Colocasia esculenta]|nr:hypothetical protein [Colocasia esculenta]
ISGFKQAPSGKFAQEATKSPGINHGLPTRTPEINGFEFACQLGTTRSMTFKSPVNSGNTHPGQPKLDVRTHVQDHARCGRVRKSQMHVLSENGVKRTRNGRKTHVGCSSNARGHVCVPGCTPAGPGKVRPRQTRQGDTPAGPGRGTPRQTSPGLAGLLRWSGGPPGLGMSARTPAEPHTPAEPLAKTPINRGAGPSFGPPASRGAKLSRGDPRLRDFSSPTLARRSRVPAKLEAVWRSRILSRRSSGEIRPCGMENGKDSLTVRASRLIRWSGTHVASMKLSWV